MALAQSVIDDLAAKLDRAEIEACPILPVHADHPDMEWGDAYAVQEALARHKAARGCRIVGMKMGATSKAKWDQMGIADPCYGFLTDYGEVVDGGDISVAGLIHPRVEAEIAFMTKAELAGPDCTVEQVLAATDFVVPALEIIDSRYREFKFDMKSVIADNTSAARFVLGGAPRRPHGLDMRDLGMVVVKSGEVQATAAASEVLGHPAFSVATLARLLSERGHSIPAGTLVLSGGATAAIAAAPGDNFQLRCQDLGTVSVRFTS